MATKLYAERDLRALGQQLYDHVAAMTVEGLHDKVNIAAELAWRDQRIAELEQRLAAQDALLRRVCDAATAAERQRCAAVCRTVKARWGWHAVAPVAAEACAAAIERQEGA